MYLHEDKEQFAQAVNLASYQFSVMESIVEKDYYVTMLLRLLAERIPSVVFKGGTSLSKCHKAILRFSEDIDIAVDTSLSQGKKKKLKYTLVNIVKELGLEILNLDETQSRKDYNRYIIAYNTVLSQPDDAYKLLPLVEQDDGFRKLVEEVRSVRKLSNVCPSAQDGVDIPKLLNKIIDEEVYRGDYIKSCQKE